MIPELGHLALILALTLALSQVVLPFVGAQRGIVGWMNVARTAAYGQCFFIVIAFSSLCGEQFQFCTTNGLSFCCYLGIP
jgi:cytochrome c-type biogenesis protein CcmF